MRTFAEAKAKSPVKVGWTLRGQSPGVQSILRPSRLDDNRAEPRSLLPVSEEHSANPTSKSSTGLENGSRQIPGSNCQHASVQTKLNVSTIGDRYEREADRVAEQVMRMPEPPVQPHSVQRRPTEKTERLDQCEGTHNSTNSPIQSQANANGKVLVQAKRGCGCGARQVHDGANIELDSFKGQGQPLPNTARTFFESRMGNDFGDVRIHTDDKAADAAQSIQAKAFTLGRHIVFGANQYQPNNYVGRKILAHELTHTVQQSTVPNTVMRIPQPGPAPRRPGPSPGATTTVVNTSSGPMSKTEFERRMLREFGVKRFRVGSHADQNKSIGTTIPASQWKAWSPGKSSEVYRLIFNAFNEFAWTFGGAPIVNEIVFYRMHFDSQKGAAVAMPDVGASFGGGQMTIYSRATSSTARMGLPFSRSNASGDYPGGPILGVSGQGSSPGAPIAVPTKQQGVSRVIWHELGHSLAETASNRCGASAARDPNMLRDYQRAVGWQGGHLFDIGNSAVAIAIAKKTAPPAGTEITQNDWNDPKWIEQPISAYMVSAAGEDFAEAVRAHVEDPDLLMARSPARHRFIETRVRALTQCLRQVLRKGDFPIPADDGTRIA